MKSRRVLAALSAALLAVAVSSCSKSGAGKPATSVRDALKFVEASNTPLAQPGAFLIPKLIGDAATNHLKRLERFRHFSKQAGFEACSFPEGPGAKQPLRYLLFKPKADLQQPLSLVLSLHGGGPRRHFEDLLTPYAPGFAYGLGRFTSPETQQEHPCFVVAPWSNGRGWDEANLATVLALLDHLQAEFKIDAARIYVTGQSMGGFGTWSIITQVPARFAAAVPICGGGAPRSVGVAKEIPIWAFHGSTDTVVPVEQTRGMIRALLETGAHPIYWEYTGATHADTAERAYCEPELIEWMFAQKKSTAGR